MKRWPSFLMRPWILAALLGGSFLMSLSFAIRFARSEADKVTRLQRSLQQMRTLRRQVDTPASGLILLRETGVAEPLAELPEALRAAVRPSGTIRRRPLDAGLDRLTLELELQDLNPADLGALLSGLEGASRGWWITEARLQASGIGLTGQLTLEALDSSPGED